MGNSSSSARPCMSEGDGRRRMEAGGVAATPPSSSTTSRASSFEKTVLLHDWWLIKVEDECSRARLAVGGLATTGKAVRIFKSAPIVKRYDGYTLETADGITVRIQGFINVSRMHQNGFPSEACNHFQVGFPYCWKYYADRYFQTDTEVNGAPTCASDFHDYSMNLANTASYSFPVCSKEFPVGTFPVCSKEFPVGRIVECLNSICKEIIDGAKSSTDTAQNLCKNNDCKENTNGIVTQAHDNIVVSDGNINVAEENAHVAPNNDAQDGLKQVSTHVSSDSLLCGNMNIDSLLEEVTRFQRECLATAVAGPDNEKQQFGHASIDVDGLVKDIDGNTCCINAASAVESRPKVLLSKSLPDNWEESVSIAPNENHPCNEAEQVVHLSVTTLSHESDVEHMNSPGVQLQIDSLNPVSSDTVCTAKRASNSFTTKDMTYKCISVSQNSAGTNHNPGQSGAFNHLGTKVGFTNAMHLEVSDVTGNSSDMASNHVLSRHSDGNIFGSVADNEKQQFGHASHVGITVSESPNKQFPLRRSERLSKLKIPAEDAEISLEHNNGSLHKTNSLSVADGTHNRQSSISCVAEHAKEVCQLIEADMQNLYMPTREQSNSGVGISCVAEYAKEVSQLDAHVNAQPNVAKSSARLAKRSRKRSHFALQVGKTPLTRQRTKELSLASPELLNLKRSRSGRLLVPTLSNWCQQILYDVDGSVAGISTGVDAFNCDHRGTRSEPSGKKKKKVT